MLDKILSEVRSTNLEFVDLQWEHYSALKYNEDKKRSQVNNLFYSGLQEPNNGIEFTFVPTCKMKTYEEALHKLYYELRVVDHSVSVCSEVFFTSKIEGANTTLVRTQQIHNGEFLDMNNLFSESMIKGGFEATKYLNIIGNRVDTRSIRKCWEILTDNCRDNSDIEGFQYRTGNVQVGNHVGLNFLLLDDMMNKWIDYYNGSQLSKYPFIKAAFLHYTFEHIHPFCDGNGRMGRLLMNNFLIKEGYDKVKAVSFSKSIDKSRFGYDLAFYNADNVYSDCTYFIEYMLLKMLDAFEDCIDGKLKLEDS